MRGTSFILILYLLLGIFHYSRWALSGKEESPAVVRLHPHLTTIGVMGGDGLFRLHQMHDASKLMDVIKLTGKVPPQGSLQGSLSNEVVLTGSMFELVESEGEFHIEKSWLSAGHRILLQIPLHPDRMTLLDWESLPGIGPKLAAAIETDRQKYGDFVEFTSLERVKGIGKKKLESWRGYFFEKDQ